MGKRTGANSPLVLRVPSLFPDRRSSPGVVTSSGVEVAAKESVARCGAAVLSWSRSEA